VAWSCIPLTHGPVKEDTAADLAAFLLSHAGNTTYLAAVPSIYTFAPTLIIDTGKPVMAIGGFFGTDQILTVKEMPELVHHGTVRYFLEIPGNRPLNYRMARGTGENDAIFSWVSDHCTEVPASVWNENGDFLLRQYTLYDCAGAG
jgi:4-amino-4-deoxy-L-arabinose transferase-like glycosyltransferase